jgi:hypothetical protein
MIFLPRLRRRIYHRLYVIMHRKRKPLTCRLGLHRWHRGPGLPCIRCGAHDVFYCPCETCHAFRQTTWTDCD